ncbi:putative type VI secretion system effector, partial [Photorhabdus asymbiotica]
GLMAMVFSPLIYFSCMRNPKPTFRLAEEIFTVLGFPDPTEINLEKFTKKRLKEIKANYPDGKADKEGERVLPDKGCFLSYYYYY